MNQTALELDASPCAVAIDRDGFDIGWDHAHHGLVPPAGLLLAGTPVCQGWMAGKTVFGQRTLGCTPHTRQWLQLRTHAWRLGIAFERQQLTPNYLAQIQTARCPVTRQLLQGAADQPDTRVVARLNAQAGYAAGNLAVMSLHATRAWESLGVQDCVRLAHRAAAAAACLPASAVHAPAAAAPAPDLQTPSLNSAAWWRLAALRSFATPLPFAVAAGLPMAVLPPNRVRLLNAVQGLQALLTRSFASAGWSERCRRFAQWLPEHTLRQDFNLFVGAMAPRVLEAGHDRDVLRQALEDAWLSERVQRRWQHFALSLGEAGTERMLALATAAGLAGVRTLHHGREQATDGWALPTAAVAVRDAPRNLATRGVAGALALNRVGVRSLSAQAVLC
jgi:hypothetical protein